jgi:hypothetical protein
MKEKNIFHMYLGSRKPREFGTREELDPTSGHCRHWNAMKELGEMRRAFPQAETDLTSLYNKRKTSLLRKRDAAAARSLPANNTRDEGTPPFLPSFVKTNEATKYFKLSLMKNIFMHEVMALSMCFLGYITFARVFASYLDEAKAWVGL